MIFLITFFILFASPAVAADESVSTRLYVPLSRQITVFKENSGQSLLIKDYLSSTREVDVAYFPYGGDAGDGDISTDRAFTGHRKLEEAGVYHAGARFYNPQLGIFTQPDPVEGPHRYGYVQNNPISNIDPDGHQSMSGFLDDAGRALAQAAEKLATSGKLTQARTWFARLLSHNLATAEKAAATKELRIGLSAQRDVPTVIKQVPGDLRQFDIPISGDRITLYKGLPTDWNQGDIMPAGLHFNLYSDYPTGRLRPSFQSDKIQTRWIDEHALAGETGQSPFSSWTPNPEYARVYAGRDGCVVQCNFDKNEVIDLGALYSVRSRQVDAWYGLVATHGPGVESAYVHNLERIVQRGDEFLHYGRVARQRVKPYVGAVSN